MEMWADYALKKVACQIVSDLHTGTKSFITVCMDIEPTSQSTAEDALVAMIKRHDGVIPCDQVADYLAQHGMTPSDIPITTEQWQDWCTTQDKLCLSKDGGSVLSHPLLSAERVIMTSAKALCDPQTATPIAPSKHERERLRREIAQKLRASNENEDPRVQTVYDLLTLPSRLLVISGPPGSTKSSLARLAMQLLRNRAPRGQEAWVVAQNYNAMAKFRDRAHISGTTLAQLITDADEENTEGDAHKPLIGEGALVAVDEAGLIGTKALSKLMQLAERHNWQKLILMGDTRQEYPTASGQPLAMIQKAFPTLCFQLSQTFRQKTSLGQQVTLAVYNGQAREALDLLDGDQAVVMAQGREQTLRRALSLYYQHISAHPERVCHILVSESEDADLVNRWAFRGHGSSDKVHQTGHSFRAGLRVRTIYPVNAVADDTETPVFLPPGRMGTIISNDGGVMRMACDRKSARGPQIVRIALADAPMLSTSVAMTVRAAQGLAADNIIWAITDAVTGPTAVSATSRHRYALMLAVNQDVYPDYDSLADHLSHFPTKPLLVEEMGEV